MQKWGILKLAFTKMNFVKKALLIRNTLDFIQNVYLNGFTINKKYKSFFFIFMLSKGLWKFLFHISKTFMSIKFK